MSDNAAAILLGLVQGLTEFLPVSSSGHLILVSSLLGLKMPSLETFEVVIQIGSILAVVVLYRQRFFALCDFSSPAPMAGYKGLWRLFLTCLPASAIGLFTHDFITDHLFTPLSVAAALAAGALFILFAEWRNSSAASGLEARIDTRIDARIEAHNAARIEARPDACDKANGEALIEAREETGTKSSINAISPAMAFGIGCFQCLALWPGFSRSTATIMGGLLLGAKRKAAAEYSFLAAVPIMCGAALLSLIDALPELSMSDLPFFALGTGMSFLSAMVAIKLLMRLISRMSFRPFAWYRLLLAPLIFWFWM